MMGKISEIKLSDKVSNFVKKLLPSEEQKLINNFQPIVNNIYKITQKTNPINSLSGLKVIILILQQFVLMVLFLLYFSQRFLHKHVQLYHFP